MAVCFLFVFDSFASASAAAGGVSDRSLSAMILTMLASVRSLSRQRTTPSDSGCPCAGQSVCSARNGSSVFV